MGSAARERSEGASSAPPSSRWPCTCAPCSISRRGRADARLRQQHPPDGAGEGVDDAFDFPGLRAGLYPAAVLPRHRAVPLGGAVRRSGGHLPHRRESEGTAARRPPSPQLARHGAKRIKFQGLPARICWVGLGDRHRLGLAFNEMVASGEVEAPIVIGRDHLDSGSVARPNRETEAMRDGSDAVSDWPLLNALAQLRVGARPGCRSTMAAASASAYSQHAGMVIVCDGTPEAARRHRARAVERPGDRRDAPCRCRL